MPTLQELIQQAMQMMADKADLFVEALNVFKGESERHETARQQMVAQNLATSQSILSQLTPVMTQTDYFIDQSAPDGGLGTSESPSNDLFAMIKTIPAGVNARFYLREGQNHYFGDPQSTDLAVCYLVSPMITFSRWGGATDTNPKIVAPLLGLDTSPPYTASQSKVWLVNSGSIVFDKVDFEYELKDGLEGVQLHGSQCPFNSLAGANLRVRIDDYSVINLRDGELLIGVHFQTKSIHLDIGCHNAEIKGGGILCNTAVYATVKLSVIATSIGTDTYFLNFTTSDKRNVLTSYNGNQLAKNLV